MHTSTTCRDQTQTHSVCTPSMHTHSVHPPACLHACTHCASKVVHAYAEHTPSICGAALKHTTSIPQTDNPLSCTQPVKSTLTIPNHSVPACVLAEWAPTAKQQSLGPSLLSPATWTLFICMFYPCLLALVQLEAVTQCLAWLRTTMSPVHSAHSPTCPSLFLVCFLKLCPHVVPFQSTELQLFSSPQHPARHPLVPQSPRPGTTGQPLQCPMNEVGYMNYTAALPPAAVTAPSFCLLALNN